MSAEILAFDPNRRVRPRHYTPIAMRGRLLYMPSRTAEANSAVTFKEESSWCAVPYSQRGRSQAGRESGTHIL
jgi:hypothetical protein